MGKVAMAMFEVFCMLDSKCVLMPDHKWMCTTSGFTLLSYWCMPCVRLAETTIHPFYEKKNDIG